MVYRQRYVFDIQVHTHKNNHPRRQRQHPPRLLHPEQPPRYKTPAPPSPAPQPISALRSSDVFVAAKQRLKDFLDLSRGSDFQISFNQPLIIATATPLSVFSSPASEHSAPPVPSFSAGSAPGFIMPEQLCQQQQRQCTSLQDVDDREKGARSRDTGTLFVHSCIMSTVASPAMKSILDTYPPPSLSPPSTPPSASTAPFNAPSPAFAATHTFNSSSRSNTHHSPSLGSESTYHPALFTLTQHRGLTPSFSQQRQQQPIREIRFQDVPPEVVRAVVRYIYMGQKPVLEPYCGYTVKDLMALSSYLEIEPLEDYCVQLVLGIHRNTDASSSGSDDDFGNVNYSYSSVVGGEGYARWTNSFTHRRGRRSKSRISPEMAVKVLFEWGYRYTKVRAALICALIDSNLADEEQDLFGSPEGEGEGVGLLQSFAGHDAFHAILCEMVEWQLNRRL